MAEPGDGSRPFDLVQHGLRLGAQLLPLAAGPRVGVIPPDPQWAEPSVPAASTPGARLLALPGRVSGGCACVGAGEGPRRAEPPRPSSLPPALSPVAGGR